MGQYQYRADDNVDRENRRERNAGARVGGIRIKRMIASSGKKGSDKAHNPAKHLCSPFAAYGRNPRFR